MYKKEKAWIKTALVRKIKTILYRDKNQLPGTQPQRTKSYNILILLLSVKLKVEDLKIHSHNTL